MRGTLRGERKNKRSRKMYEKDLKIEGTLNNSKEA